MEASTVATLVTAIVIAPALSWVVNACARFVFLRRRTDEERARIRRIEETLGVLDEARRAGNVSAAQMQDLMRKVVETSLTEDRGERLLNSLASVRVDEGREAKEAMLKSAERSLHARFSRRPGEAAL